MYVTVVHAQRVEIATQHLAINLGQPRAQPGSGPRYPYSSGVGFCPLRIQNPA